VRCESGCGSEIQNPTNSKNDQKIGPFSLNKDDAIEMIT